MSASEEKAPLHLSDPGSIYNREDPGRRGWADSLKTLLQIFRDHKYSADRHLEPSRIVQMFLQMDSAE